VRRLSVLKLRFGKGAVDVPAYQNLDGITLVVRKSDGTSEPRRIAGTAPTSGDDEDDADMDDLERAF
jgi:hypothetical protein